MFIDSNNVVFQFFIREELRSENFEVTVDRQGPLSWPTYFDAPDPTACGAKPQNPCYQLRTQLDWRYAVFVGMGATNTDELVQWRRPCRASVAAS